VEERAEQNTSLASWLCGLKIKKNDVRLQFNGFLYGFWPVNPLHLLKPLLDLKRF